MKTNLGLEFKVGLFTVVGLVTTASLFLYLSKDPFSQMESKRYYTLLKNAKGIVPKSHVKTNGVSVGQVISVDLDDFKTRVVFEVDRRVVIPKGSSLAVKSVGLLGDTHIEILRSDNQEELPENSLIPEQENSYDVNSLVELAGQVINENRANVKELIENFRQASEKLDLILEENRQDIRKIVADFREAAASVRGILDEENREKIDRIIASFDETMGEVKSASRSIKLISQKVERGEGTIGRLVNDDQTLDDLQGAIRDIRKVLAPATKLSIAVDTHIEARRDETSQTYFNLVFRTRPDRFYLIGFTDLTEETIETKTFDTTSECQDGDEACQSGVRELRTQKKALRFNLQFAKTWGFLTGRFGLFESTGGLAFDVSLLRDKLKLSVEAFDWKTKDNPLRRVAHFKAYLSILFFNHIYLLAGLDDPTKYERRGIAKNLQKPNYFFGAGLTFNDEDLKGLFGAAALTSSL